MSHFAVLVSVPDGKTLEEVMLPYHEFECTGIEAYIKNVDITEEVRKNGLEYHGLEDRTVTNEDQIDITGKHKYGYAVVVDGQIVKAVDRTNPNKKWDWYVVGGRWDLYIWINQGTKRQFDFDAARDRILYKMIEKYRKFHTARRVVSVTPEDIESAKKLLDGRWKENKTAHKLYSDPAELAFDKKAFNAIDDHFWSLDDAELMHMTKKEYRSRYKYDALVHSFIDLAGNWIERGDMGWFGMCNNENEDAYSGEHGKFWEFIRSLPDDTMLYVVDCHI